MRNVRLVLRCVALALVTLVCWVVLMVGLLPALAIGRDEGWRRGMTGIWSRILLAIFGVRVRVRGDVPGGGFLLVTNHLSYMDIPLLSSRAGCAFVSKDDVASWPLIGYLAKLVGTVFVDRTRRRDVVRVGEAIRAKLDRGSRLVLFPEGTSTAGDEVVAFKSSLLEPAASAELPVRYATLRYSTPPGEVPARMSVAWWGEMSLAPHLLDLLRMPGFEATIVFGDEPIRASDRKVLAERLRDAVARNFETMLSRGEPVADEPVCLSSRTSPASS